MNKSDKFTVITTCYNDEKSVYDFYKMLKGQTLQPVEYILVDGGSKDNTVAVANRCREELCMNISVRGEKRMNISQGLNFGIRLSTTQAIIITGIGNKYNDDFFKTLVDNYMNNDVQVVYGVTFGNENTYFSKVYNRLYIGGKQGIGNLPTNRGMLIECDIYEKIGYYYENFYYAGEDVEFYERIKKANIKIGYTKDAVLYWDTPSNIKEFNKQQRAYFIGGLQIYGVNKRVLVRSVLCWLFLILALCCLVLFVKTLYPYIALFALYILVSIRIRSFSPLALYLKVNNCLSPLCFYLKYKKYAQKII